MITKNLTKKYHRAEIMDIVAKQVYVLCSEKRVQYSVSQFVTA